MNIGYARLGFPIEINIDTGSISTLGTEIRAGLLNDWVELGYNVILVSEVKNLDKSLIKNQGLEGRKWYHELDIDETGFPELDVLFIECGSKNLMYQGKYGSYVERVNKLVEKYSCSIVYYQHGHLPYYELKKFGKNITILHHFSNEEKFKLEFKNYEFGDKIKAKFIPLGYSDSDKKLEVNKYPKWDLLWVGGENDSNKKQGTKRNTRKDIIVKYFANTPYKAKIIGRWSEDTMKELVEKASFLGALGKHGDAYKYFNNSVATLWSGSISTKETGLIPTRPIMALRSGSIVLSEPDMCGITKLIPERYLVNNSKDVERVLNSIKALSLEQRQKECDDILKNFPKWKDIKWEEVFEK